MSRGLLLLGLALCCLAPASAEPRIELSANPAWKGWTRPGRTTEIDIRLKSDVETRASLDVDAGRESVGASVELQPGRVARVQIAIAAAPASAVHVRVAPGAAAARDVTLAQSESPLLGLALASGESVTLEGFHAIALAADDLPRNASAYSSIDALIVDAPTLAALDQRQLGALVTYTADCGRLVVLNAGAEVQRLIDGARGCGGRAATNARSLAEAKAMLSASLATSVPAALSLGSVGALARPGHAAWNAVAVGLAVYFAATALALVYLPALPVILLAPALAIAALLGLLQVMQPRSQLVVWSEGKSGATLARYQAWQRFPGILRERVRVPLPPQLGSAVQPCEAGQAMRFEVDASGGQALSAAFETRLFRQVALCYRGTFPMERSIAIATRADGSHAVRNSGARAWPSGVLLVGGVVHELPAIAPGTTTIVGAEARRAVADDALRLASTRTGFEESAALWALDLSGVAGAPVDSTGWLLVAMPPGP
ncbi:MAG: hypothetical protein ABI520_01585 [Caldimonas sp.]